MEDGGEIGTDVCGSIGMCAYMYWLAWSQATISVTSNGPRVIGISFRLLISSQTTWRKYPASPSRLNLKYYFIYCSDYRFLSITHHHARECVKGRFYCLEKTKVGR